jgi:hypothetical protein
VFRGRNTPGFVLVATLTALLALPVPANATFPGANGKLAFTSSRDGNQEIYSMNADGSGVLRLTNDPGNDGAPAWSPDGSKILFVSNRSGTYQIWVMTEFGGAPTQLTTQGGLVPVWYPDGASFEYMLSGAIHRRTLDGSSDVQLTPPSPPCDYNDPDATSCDHYVDFDLSPDGTQHVVDRYHEEFSPCPRCPGNDVSDTDYLSIGTTGGAPSWAPDQSRIAFHEYHWDEFNGFHYGLGTVRPDASDKVILRDAPAFNPAWSPDGTKVAFVEGNLSHIKLMNADGTNVTDIGEGAAPAWQSIPINGYPRPKGASPMRLSLVPAASQCTSPNTTHGAPLAFGSCAPGTLASQYLTTGTPDANGLGAQMNAYMILSVVPGNPSTTADEADVQIRARINDVFTKTLADYTGTLNAKIPLRIIDKDNTPAPGGPGAATTVAFPFSFQIPCTPDPAVNVGSDCSIATTADTLMPGAVKETRRTIWHSVGPVKVDDGGSDGDGSTTADNTLFATQGVFVP